MCACLHKGASCQGITPQRDDLLGHANPPELTPRLTTALTSTLVLDSTPGIVHCDSRKPLWFDSPCSGLLECYLSNCYSGNGILNFHHTIPHLQPPFHRLHNQVTETLDDNTEKVSRQTTHWTLCVYEHHSSKQKGGGGTQSFLGAKNKKTKRF